MPDYSSLDVFWLIYNSFIKSSTIAWSIGIAKGICTLFIAVYYFRLFFSSSKVNGDPDKELNFYQLFRPFFLVCIVVSFSYIMDTFDGLAKSGESYVYSQVKAETSTAKLIADKKKQVQAPPVQEKNTVLGEVASSVSSIAVYIEHPSLLLVKILDACASFIDFYIYTFVITLRFAFLFILRFLGPIAIALSIYPKYESFWVKWLTAYGLLYLWILCIFLVNYFAALIAHTLYKLITADNSMISDTVAAYSYTSTFITLVVLKLYLYFKSKGIIQKLFTV
jgi:hypothetical protein